MAEITDFGPRKTIFILAIVAGCFAVLWPKIFYPMLTASVTPHHTPDNSACCDVIFESDVTAADIMQEMCQNILKHHQVDPRVRDALKSVKLSPQSSNFCREEILARCGIDLITFLADRERLGKSHKQVLEEIRSFNSSLCLKTHFGIPLSQLGTPHLIRYHILMPHSTIPQERRTPPHAGGLHPALRERGRAIPSSHIVPKVTDRPDHVIPKMRPPLGGAGHVVSAPKGTGTMGIIMPLYTLGIVLFFLYTIMKVLKKNSDSEIISEYPGAAAEKEFRKMVFSPEAFATAMTGGTMHYCKERSQSPHRPVPTIEELKDLRVHSLNTFGDVIHAGTQEAAGDIEIDQLRRRLVETEAAMERIVVQMGNISRSVMHSPSSQQELKDDAVVDADHSKADEEVANIENSPTVKVMGMEMTASCEGKGSRPTTPIIPVAPSHVEREKTPPKPIYLEGALPPQCELLVTDSETQEQKTEEDAEAPVVLSGKMTLSLISVDQNAAESEGENQEGRTVEDEIVLSMDHTGLEHESLNIGSTGEKQVNGKMVEDDGSENQQEQKDDINVEDEEDELDEEREQEEDEEEEEEEDEEEIEEVEDKEEEEEIEEEEEDEADEYEEEEIEEEEEVEEVEEEEEDEADEYEEEEIEEEEEVEIEEDNEENENEEADESESGEEEAEDETDEEEESETDNIKRI